MTDVIDGVTSRPFASRVAAGLLIAAVPVAIIDGRRWWPVVVVGDWVPPAAWAAAALFAAGVTTLVVRLSLRAMRPPADRRPFGMGAVVGTAGLLIAGLLAVLHSLLTLPTYHVLTPASPDGCRVVAAERTFLLAGWGELGTSAPGDPVTFLTDGYVTADGYRPFTSDTYLLTWDGDRAELTILSTPVGAGDGRDTVSFAC